METLFSIIFNLETSGWIWPNFKPIQALMHVIITCKYEKDSTKNKREKSGDIVFPIISLWGFFSDAQELLTPQSVVQSCRNSNSSELSCMLSLPASMKTRQRFLHYNPMGAFCCHGNQKSDPILPKTLGSLSPNPIMLKIKFGCDRPTGCRDIHV